MTKVKAEEDIFAFRPENKAGWFERYKASINFKGSLSCSGSYNDYERNRVKDVDSVKASEGSAIPLTERLKAATSAEALSAKAVIADKLKFDPKGCEQFNKDIANINNLIAAPNPKFHPGDIAQYLLIRKGEENKAIKAEHELRKNELIDAFDNDAAFRTALKRSLNDCSDDDLNALKAEIIAARDKSHEEELAKLEKSIGDNATQLFNASRDEFRRISFLAAAYHRHGKLTDEIAAMMEGETSIAVNGSGSDASLKKADPKQLTKSESVAGDTAIKQGDTIVITTSRFWESNKSIQTRVASEVEQMLAGGVENITLTVRNKDPKEAARVAQLVFEGAVDAGADPEKLTIVVNDDVKWKYNEKGEHEKNELFKQEPERLKFAREKAADLRGQEEKFYKGTEANGQRVKDELQALRQAQPVDEAEPQHGQQIQPI